MSTALATKESNAALMERVLLEGDLSRLDPAQRVAYYRQTCESLGLNWLTKPFDYIKLNGKLTLYAKRDCADQLRQNRRISIYRLDKEIDGDTFVVTAYARTPDGREDSDMGIVSIKGKSGEDLANAKLKAVTKAKRRVTLSIVGLGFLDETEVETIPHAQPVTVIDSGEIIEATAEAVKEPSPREAVLKECRSLISQLSALGHPTFQQSTIRGEQAQRILNHLRGTAKELDFACDAALLEGTNDLNDEELNMYRNVLLDELNGFKQDIDEDRVF